MQTTGLLTVSVPLVDMVTSVTYQPLLPSVPAVTAKLAEGGLISRLIVRVGAFVVRPAAFVQLPANA